MLEGHDGIVNSVAWSPDGSQLASCSNDCTIRLWDPDSDEPIELGKHSGYVYCIAWSGDGRFLASASKLEVRIWDPKSRRKIHDLQGHTGKIHSLEFSPDCRFLASISSDDTVRLWRTDRWVEVACLSEPSSGNLGGMAFHPTASILTFRGSDAKGNKDHVVQRLQYDSDALLGTTVSETRYYRNAKVVLVGATGSGKSSLARALTGQPFKPTDPIECYDVKLFDYKEIPLQDDRREIRETRIWDLAGQRGYEAIHHLHLGGVAVAVVVFYEGSETDFVSTVREWDRALQHARRLHGDEQQPLTKILVAARTDQSRVSTSEQIIDEIIKELGFHRYIEVSAKGGVNIDELRKAICDGIEWESLLRVSSNKFFQTIKNFLKTERNRGRVLAKEEDLYQYFCKSQEKMPCGKTHKRFSTCVSLLEGQGLIRRLQFGRDIILQPEYLDYYAAAMIRTAKSPVDGLGCLTEEKAFAGDLKMSEVKRVPEQDERHLLISTVAELLEHEIALEEATEKGKQLIFPSEFSQERPESVQMPKESVVYQFEGPHTTIYTKLAIRLAYSSAFERKEMWKNAALFESDEGGTLGIELVETKEGDGELVLYFGEGVAEKTCQKYENYCAGYLRNHAASGSVRLREVCRCKDCDLEIAEETVRKALKMKRESVFCSVCRKEIPIRRKRKPRRPMTQDEITRSARESRDLAVSTTIYEGKLATKDYDVFLCHNSKDKTQVRCLADKLIDKGILPFLDDDSLVPGKPWLEGLAKALKKVKAVAVFVGPHGLGDTQRDEVRMCHNRYTGGKMLLIPVYLPGGNKSDLPDYLTGKEIDFRKEKPDALNLLVQTLVGLRDDST